MIFMQVNVLFLIQKIFLLQNHPQISVIHWKNVFGSQTKCEMCGNFEIYVFFKIKWTYGGVWCFFFGVFQRRDLQLTDLCCKIWKLIQFKTALIHSLSLSFHHQIIQLINFFMCYCIITHHITQFNARQEDYWIQFMCIYILSQSMSTLYFNVEQTAFIYFYNIFNFLSIRYSWTLYYVE